MSRPPHIVFINRYFWPDRSATSQLLSDLAFHLAGLGWSITVLTGRYGYHEGMPPFAPEETHRGVHILRFGGHASGRHTAWRRLRDYAGFFAGLRAPLARLRRQADWIISLTDPPLLSLLQAPRLQEKCRHAVWTMDLFPEIAALYSAHPVVRWAGGLLQRPRDASFRQCRQLIALGQDMADYLVSLGLPPERVSVLYNWAVEEEDALPGQVDKLRRDWNLQGQFVLGYSGNLGRVHDTGAFLSALPFLQAEPDLRCLFTASGKNLQSVRENLPADWHSRCLFLDPRPREELAASLRVPDLHWFSLAPTFTHLVFPSKFAGILAAGKPCLFVGQPDSEIARLIRESGCGWTVAPDQPEAFAAAVRDALRDPPHLAAMGLAARRLYEQRFRRADALRHWQKILSAPA